jgi:hypothetical protein
MKQLAAEGRTIFVSSHLMNEMAVTADHLIVIGKGRLIADCPTQEFIELYAKFLLIFCAARFIEKCDHGEGGFMPPSSSRPEQPPIGRPLTVAAHHVVQRGCIRDPLG